MNDLSQLSPAPDTSRTPLAASAPGRPQGVWLHEQPPSPSPLSWLWRGYLAHGFLTLLTSQWKTGKTTLLAVLLARA